MGLDIYFFESNKHAQPGENSQTQLVELHYWRKHNRLMNAMTAVLNLPDGVENCQSYPLTTVHLDELESRILDPDIKLGDNAKGFFWGGDYEYDDETQKDDLEAVAKARASLAEGNGVAFWAWW